MAPWRKLVKAGTRQLTEYCMYVRQSCWGFQELLRFEWVFLGHADFDDVTKLKKVSLDK